MEKTINKLVRRYKTNCPYTIAQELGIRVSFADLGKSTRGIYYRKLRRRFIVIHNALSQEWQRFVCAHELGHERLHKGVGHSFSVQNTLHNPGKYERQANLFAVRLLVHEDQVGYGETAEEVCRRNGVPKEMQHYFFDH